MSILNSLNRRYKNSMPPKTERLFNAISEIGLDKNFVLVGGTALSIHLQHRLSEDLDFCFQGIELNKKSINLLLHEIHERGFSIEKKVNTIAEQEFLNDGLELDDFHQSYFIDGVKVDFFTNQTQFKKLQVDSKQSLENINIASIDTIFKMKANLILSRTKSRDFFDLMYLMENRDYNIESLINSIYEERVIRPALTTIINRLSVKHFPASDEGLEGLNIDVTPEYLFDYFHKTVREYKRNQIIDHIDFTEIGKP